MFTAVHHTIIMPGIEGPKYQFWVDWNM